jgi:hypothetical protein
MKLILTHYIDVEPEAVTARLDAAVAAGLDAAAMRSDADRSDTVTTPVEHGVHIDGGLDALNGTECTFTGTAHLTEVRVEVPWSASDSGTTKLWAANRFAGVLAQHLAAA